MRSATASWNREATREVLGIGSKARIRPVPHNIDTEIRVAVALVLCMSGYVTLA
jgi:hypothetical protein